jgi:hypothetical protein
MPHRIRIAVISLWRTLFDNYRPERHYMRGPGPRWRAKHEGPREHSTKPHCRPGLADNRDEGRGDGRVLTVVSWNAGQSSRDGDPEWRSSGACQVAPPASCRALSSVAGRRRSERVVKQRCFPARAWRHQWRARQPLGGPTLIRQMLAEANRRGKIKCHPAGGTGWQLIEHGHDPIMPRTATVTSFD